MRNYFVWLTALSIAFAALERLRPRDPGQGFLRPHLLTDAFYLVFNGHFLGVLLATLSTPLVHWIDARLAAVAFHDVFYLDLVAAWPIAVQVAVALVVVDFLHWHIHRLLHHVPALWEFHKVHHSTHVLDWWTSLRFHWMEVVVYKSLTYPLLALFGFSGEALFVLAIINTASGHFNHANLSADVGWLRYLINNPAMHIWHHTHPDSGPVNRNFAITLSVWDWLFGTAYLPEAAPEKLGFTGVEDFPPSAPEQLVHPLPLGRFVRR